MNREQQHSGLRQHFPRLALVRFNSLRNCLFSSINLLGIVTLITALNDTTLAAPVPLLSSWRYHAPTNQLEVVLQQKTTPRYFLLDRPARIVLDLPNTQVGKVTTQQNYAGAVRQVRVSQFAPNVTRIVLELAPDVVTSPKVELQRVTQRGMGDRWVLRTQARQPHQLPPATFSTPQPGVVSVPPLAPVNPVPTRSTSEDLAPIIDFGQPLPPPSEQSPAKPTPTPGSVVVPSNSSSHRRTNNNVNQAQRILLPAGSRLNLRYAGAELILPVLSPQSVQLLLAEDIRDRLPNTKTIFISKVIAPAGTPVTGRFESDARGSKFIASAITLRDRNIPLVAESELLNANRNPNPSTDAVPTTAVPTLLPGAIVQIRLKQHLLKF